MSNSFYREFEDRHRGSRDLIKTRLAAYLPFLQPLVAAYPSAVALDLGCGRGEWLELLGENGFKAKGVDLDEGMLAACRERGFDVSSSDALASLRSQPDASLALVSAFHLIEHIPFDAMQELISEALRALQPGGLLIMETPNPENLVVATSGFYMDPSHLRPIPPPLLDFLAEYAGFNRHKLVRLQEPAQLHGTGHLELINVLNGVSPDYSVVAQKSAAPEMLADFEPAFAANYGLSLSTLAERYNAQETRDQSELMADMRELKERVSSVETNTSEQLLRTLGTFNEMQLAAYQAHAELRASLQRENARDQEAAATALRECAAQAEQAEQQIVSLTARLAEISADGEARATLAMAALQEESIKLAKVEQHAAELAARLSHSEEHVARLYASLSWRITRPARAAIRLARIPFSAPGKARAAAEHAKAQPQALLKRLVRRLASQPRARQLAMRVLVRFPALEQRVRALAYHTLQSPVGTPPQANAQQAPELTRAAQQILSQLQHHTHHDQSSEP